MKKTHGSGHTSSIPRLSNHCFGCGPNNPAGLRLKFALDAERQVFLCWFKLSKVYTGPPGHAHGGIIATILDEAMGKANKLKSVVALTREMKIDYLRPVPLGKRLIVEGWNRSLRGRVCTNVGEIRTEEGQVLARSVGKFVTIDAEKMFAKHLDRLKIRK